LIIICFVLCIPCVVCYVFALTNIKEQIKEQTNKYKRNKPQHITYTYKIQNVFGCCRIPLFFFVFTENKRIQQQNKINNKLCQYKKKKPQTPKQHNATHNIQNTQKKHNRKQNTTNTTNTTNTLSHTLSPTPITQHDIQYDWGTQSTHSRYST